MPNLLAFDPAQYLGFVVIMARISGLFLTAPLLSDGRVPVQVKAGFVFILSLVFFPVLGAPRLPSNPNSAVIVLLLLKELAVGALIGFGAQLLFTGISLAGEVIGFQMGLGIANVFDPASDTQVPLIGQIELVFALLLFVILDGHHLLIQALVMSYRIVGPGELQMTQPLMTYYMGLAARIFVIGLQIGAPLIVAMMAANLSIGLIARSVPQVNVFVVGFPFTIALGILLLVLVFPFFIESVHALLDQVQGLMLSGLAGG